VFWCRILKCPLLFTPPFWVLDINDYRNSKASSYGMRPAVCASFKQEEKDEGTVRRRPLEGLKG